MIECKHHECKRKIILVYKDIKTCKCGNVYCDKHKFNHICTFDHHMHYKKILVKNLPKIVAKKV